MADMWGKLILVGLIGVAGWRAIGPNGHREVIEGLNMWAAEVQRKNQAEAHRSISPSTSVRCRFFQTSQPRNR